MTRFLDRAVVAAGIPAGTLLVNILGCLGVGLLSGWAPWRETGDLIIQRLLIVGFLGGFTTFSAFGLESMQLLRQGDGWRTLLHVGLHLFLGFTAVAIGLIIGGGLRQVE